MRDTKILVCEGQCGGKGARFYDALCRANLDDPALPVLARTLVHTPHVGEGERFYCTICGQSRRFGGTPLVGEYQWTRTGPQIVAGSQPPTG